MIDSGTKAAIALLRILTGSPSPMVLRVAAQHPLARAELSDILAAQALGVRLAARQRGGETGEEAVDFGLIEGVVVALCVAGDHA
jgi:hypothetical protein